MSATGRARLGVGCTTMGSVTPMAKRRIVAYLVPHRARRPGSGANPPRECARRGIDLARRAALAALACALAAPRIAAAQDPRAALVQRIAREWLALVDKLDAAASWNAAGARFREAMTPALWSETLRREREPRGQLVQRAVIATSFGNSSPELPDGGSYALVEFRSSFANQLDSREQVTLEVEPDYAWRIIGYVIL
jgi:hypothetical protein